MGTAYFPNRKFRWSGMFPASPSSTGRT